MSGGTGPQRRNGGGGLKSMLWLLALVVLAPLTVVVAAMGTGVGLWSPEIGLDLLTFRIGRFLALAGVMAGLISVVLALRDLRRRGVLAAVTVLIAAGTLGGYLIQGARMQVAAPNDVTTDTAEVPGFSRLIQDRRTAAGAAQPGVAATCDGVAFAPTQVTPEVAADALRAAGFRVIGAAPFRAEGTRVGSAFGLTHDAVIRIRPGRTDVRITARDDRAQGDQACRLLATVVRNLTS